jgi:hypothetical protein
MLAGKAQIHWIIEISHATYSNHFASTGMLNLLYVCASDESITLAARTTSAEVCCPVYGTLTRRVHSRYVRTLADLP